jgi:hypothetical protein
LWKNLYAIFDSAYELYAASDSDEKGKKAAAAFKKTFSREGAHIHFVGVWYVSKCCHQLITICISDHHQC